MNLPMKGMNLQLLALVLILWTETLAYQSPGPGPEYADVVFLVDSSDSLGSKSFPFVRTFLSKMLNSLPIEANKYRVALAQYSDSLHTEFQLSTFKSRNPMLNHLKKNFGFIGGSLKIGNALQEAHRTYFSAPTNGRDKKQFPPILVVLASAESEDDVQEASKVLREDGVKIISVGVQKASEKNLKAMATSQLHFNLRTARDLSVFAPNMTQIIKDVTKYREGTIVAPITPVAPFTPVAPIRAVAPTTSAANADETVPLPISCQKDSLADIIFLVDESVGTTQNLRNLQNFLENVTSSVDVKDNCMRLGLMSYSDRAQTISSLMSSTNQSEFQQQIQKLSLRTGGSNLGAAIEQMKKEGFSESSGSRKAQGVPQIAVLVTHRPSDDAVRDVAMDLRLEGVTMFAMGIQGANSTQLEDIVSYPAGQSISTHSSYEHLESYSETFLKKIRNEIWAQVSTHAEHVELDKTGCVDTKEADIYFLIDGSGSINKKQFEQIRIFMSSVIDMFPIGPDKVRVGVVQYSDINKVEFPISLYMDGSDLKKAVFNIKQLKGGTFTGKALNFILPIIKTGKSERIDGVPCYLVVLTDGKSEDPVLEPANRLRAENVSIHAVGIGEANKTQLQQIAGEAERVNFGQNFDSLKSIKNEIVRSICSNKGCEDMKVDIMFLVDSSGSIGPTNFEKMKMFMKSLVGKMQIGAHRTQVGLVQFSDYNKEEFQLNRYSTREEIYAQIDGMAPINRNTLTGSALTFVNQYFDPAKGGRPQVKKFLILLTDGKAQDEVGAPARALRNKGVTIFSVGVYGANRAELEEISGDSSLVFHVENFDHLKAIESKLIFRVCALHDCKRIELLDIVFVLDHSGSINPQQQESMINLTIHLVKKADIGRDRVQFGALKYSNNPEILFYLNTHSSRSAIIDHLRRPRDTGGETYTAKALQHSNILFTEEHGSRLKQNVRQLMIVITDGVSHDRNKLNDTARELRDKGITIFAVGVGAANQDELDTMAGKRENTVHVDNFDKLGDIYQSLQETLCNNSQETCNLQEADVIFLCDGSDMVSDSEFVTMTTFLSDLIDNFDIQSQRMKVGMAQYGSLYQEIIGLESSLNKTQWKSQIQTMAKSKGFPRIDFALLHVKHMFDPSVGGRRNAGVPQTLVVITSASPRYDVTDAVKVLKDLGICVLALGIGDIYKEQLLPVTGNSERIITFQDFNKLKNVDVKKRMVREICQSCGKANCFVDVVVGFDLSTHREGQPLFQGHPHLESYLPRILEAITSIRGVSCGAGAEAQVSLAFKVNNDQEFPAKFQIYQKAVFDDLLQVTVHGPTHLNAQFLQSLWDVFEERSASRAQVMLIFSDGLQGESVTMLEQQSDRLREAGLDALLVVSLDTLTPDEFPSFGFGQGFDYRTHLTIGMMDLGKKLSQYLGNVAERACCCTFCKCPGIPGPHGTRGLQGSKGFSGLKGSRGHRGEDGDPGRRGEIGLQGDRGTRGCPGTQGQKGVKGFAGAQGEHGEDGLDGLDGEDGFYGLRGGKGEKGDPGSQGSPGLRGAPGEDGETGFPGDRGNPGRDSMVKGEKGTKGEWGRQGRPGQKGTEGSPSSRGSRGVEGRRGPQGPLGEAGNLGPQGAQGPEGPQGPQGSSGNRGGKGETGSQGYPGPQGSPGPIGPRGSIGRPGFGGRKGEPGIPGSLGPAGTPGHRGEQGDYGIPGYGQMGRKGIKGLTGLPGDPGQKGDAGDPGIPGEPGPKGFKGLILSHGLKGESGLQGSQGPPGRRGPKGTAGQPVYSSCELIQFLRKHSPCWKEKCPVYPTELVFALDQSSGVTERRFNETRDIVTSIVKDLDVRETNCPVGARVAVVSYDSDTGYLIRGSDYRSKGHLLQLLSQIKYQAPQKAGDIGSAMRFVARNVFKRTSPGTNARRVAVFFSNGQADNRGSILTAAMELSALDISLAVFAYNEGVFLDEAFGFDDTGTFQVIPVPPLGDYEPQEMLRRCTLCYDKCFPNTCAEEPAFPENSYMDVAFLLDNSRNIANDDFQAMKGLVSSVIDNFHITSNPSAPNSGDRVALLSYPPSESSKRKGRVKTEFAFTTYDDQSVMKNYIHTSLQQLNGEATIGLALQWAMEDLFLGAPSPRKHKVIIVISAGENHEEKEFLRTVALRAKCQGYVIFVISLGSTQRDEMEELASYPLDHHLIQLGRMYKPDLSYIVKFLKPFVYFVRRGFNQYPPPVLEADCRSINLERGDALSHGLGLHEVSASKNSLAGQGLSAGKDSSFLLEGHGGDRLVYIPNQMLEAHKLVSHYGTELGSAATASLTSEPDSRGRKELGLADEPGDASLQEYYMDVAFLIDASQRVGHDEFKEVRDFITSVLDYFHITPAPLTSVLGDRVAVLTYSPPGYLPNAEECPAYLEFDLLTYSTVHQMKHHLQESLQQLNGDIFIGHALQWTIDNVFAGTPNLRKNKVIFIVTAGETNPLDKEVLKNASLRAKCQGYSIFVFSFGPVHNDMELEELASHPLDHHLVQLGRTHKPDLDYIIKFVKPFVYSVRRAINKYPTRDLQAKCANITFAQPEDTGTDDSVFFIPEVYKIEAGDSELFGDLGSQEQHLFLLGDNHGNHSGTTADLIRELYTLFSSGELMVNDEEEPPSEETVAPVNDKRDGEDAR
ncbi:collagen alpha-5(VI) chain [Meriones unguiculatus]|uniref:collagen alpha-5(VI) chain n=1 Tax=Meriones unguiculatus TaxID=10047 RepID=UPI000B4E97FA|nr:collagen alpha-5(VI) chain [Meriones unguiculatus]